ncbi:MAG: FtsX-like permease family protein [Sphaerochaeta sp.]|nr:FtsX-like permease family protein [Sphaerochaeta sp.]
MGLLLRLSARYAFSNQNRHRSTSVRIALGLALCLFAIVAVLSFMQALQRDQFEDIRTFESFDLQMELQMSDLGQANAVADLIEALDSVTSAFVYADIPVITQAEDGTTVAGRLRAIQAEGRFAEQLNSYRGNIFTEGKLASSYSNSRSISVGDEVKVTLLRKGRQATVIPAQRSLEIGSLYYTTSYDFDHTTFLSDLPTLLQLNPDAMLKIGLYTEQDAASVKQELVDLGYSEVNTWREIHASLYGAMELEQKMMTLMLFLMVIVVLVHIRNSSRRLLLAKQREIAMLRSMGLTKGGVQLLFVVQALLVAGIGVVLGCLLALVAVSLYPYLSNIVYQSMGVHLNVSIRSSELLILSVSILLFSMLAAFLGTHRVLKVDIMEMFAHDEVS